MSDKRKALEMALNQIERQFGKGFSYAVGGRCCQTNVEVISTGALSLDIALGGEEYLEEGLLKFLVRNPLGKLQ